MSIILPCLFMMRYLPVFLLRFLKASLILDKAFCSFSLQFLKSIIILVDCFLAVLILLCIVFLLLPVGLLSSQISFLIFRSGDFKCVGRIKIISVLKYSATIIAAESSKSYGRSLYEV